ncbi:MAG: hypothetical protein LUQ01_01105 [Methanolinea sp.]|nr:hypothetical protein [Methanolinea sp.]
MNVPIMNKKALAICGLILAVLLLVAPIAAKTLPTTTFSTKSTTGVQKYMKNYGGGASSIQEKLSYLPAINSLDLADPPEHPMPVPGELAYNQVFNNDAWNAFFNPQSGGCGCSC